ncbi:enoyl-ACP reductase FabI [Marinobacterium jannaschii]|uniref:enoyl-ACP reductase FabI n=1 Tax=Marinobacterium jannaschii TaxID=64970 RepID=UPI000481E967|nr:enoyl-ACP reductase FabI [Marinobacterium jannaschii]
MDLKGKRGLIIGIANHDSIAYGCAKVCSELGASLCITYLNDKAHKYVAPIAQELSAELLLPLDFSDESQLDALFREIDRQWGELDFVIHSVAWSPLEELHGRLIDSSAIGFMQAMDISCHSLIRLAHYAEPRMDQGGAIITMSYQGSEKVVEHYNLMGPVKAALESSVRYLAAELGEKGIRVHALSPGPMKTRAASGISDFGRLLETAEQVSPLHALGTVEDVGNMAAFLVSDRAKRITGNVAYIDAGHHIMM